MQNISLLLLICLPILVESKERRFPACPLLKSVSNMNGKEAKVMNLTCIGSRNAGIRGSKNQRLRRWTFAKLQLTNKTEFSIHGIRNILAILRQDPHCVCPQLEEKSENVHRVKRKSGQKPIKKKGRKYRIWIIALLPALYVIVIGGMLSYPIHRFICARKDGGAVPRIDGLPDDPRSGMEMKKKRDEKKVKKKAEKEKKSATPTPTTTDETAGTPLTENEEKDAKMAGLDVTCESDDSACALETKKTSVGTSPSPTSTPDETNTGHEAITKTQASEELIPTMYDIPEDSSVKSGIVAPKSAEVKTMYTLQESRV